MYKRQDGYLYCFDANTLELKWKFYCGDNPDTAMGHNVPWGVSLIADGKVYVVTGEHTMPNPVPRGNKMYCIDAFTGEPLWNITFAYQTRSTCGIHAGILWYINRYDSLIYAFGKGPTKITLSASPKNAYTENTVVIEGTVTDESPGAKGTPAIADEFMSEWMQHIYMNKPMPANVKGVWVKLDAINVYTGEVINIGGTTTDSTGFFTVAWTPPKEGLYTILAAFPGSESYYPSISQTALAVTAAPPAPETPEITPAPDYTPLFAGIIVAVAIAIIIGIANIYLIRKKKP